MKKILIIGGGISGLTAGIYAQKKGFNSIIFEKHFIPGGECTGWNRNGFHIDGCIHWLMGTKGGTGLNKVWKEVGALTDDTEIYQPEYFVKAEYEGTSVFLYRDIDKLRRHLIEVSFEDKEEIEKLCTYIEAFYDFEPPIEKPIDLMNIFEIGKFVLSMSKVSSVIKKMGKFSVREYSECFKHQAIRKALISIIPEHYSAYILPSSMATFISGNGGRPKGGSIELVRRMEETYRKLGGEVQLSKEVSKIIVNSGVAEGVVLEDGSIIHGDYVVPACDPHITYNKLLDGHYPDSKFEVRYNDNVTYPLQTSVYISLGVDIDLSDYPEDFVFQTEKFMFEDKETDMISIKHYSYEPNFAPLGKSVMIVFFHANYDWWSQKSDELYQNEKSKLAAVVVKRIEERFSQLSGKIAVLDVATPLTHERYCGAFKGSWMAFGVTPKSKQLMHNGKIKGVHNIYMAGQWLMPPGGLPTALLTGKWAIQRISKKEQVKAK